MWVVRLPMGLLAIADCVHKKGYKVQVIHAGLEKKNDSRFCLSTYIERVNPRVVGFSLHWHSQSADVLQMAERVKKRCKNVFIVFGGMTASYFHEEIVNNYSFVDAVIRGEGEIPFLRVTEEVMNGKEGFNGIPNLTWRKDNTVCVNEFGYVAGKEDLNEFNFTNFTLLKNHSLYISMKECYGRWLKGIRAGLLNLSGDDIYFPVLLFRGCLVNCSYCGGGAFSQKILSGREGLSLRSVEKVLESIRQARQYGFKGMYISYMPFEGHEAYYCDLFTRIKKERLEMSYFLECYGLPSANHVRSFSRMVASPARLRIGISPDSGSETLRRLNKGFYFSNEELLDVLELSRECGVKAMLYFSLGLPFQTEEHVRESLSFQDEVKRRFKGHVRTMMTNIVLEPASPMFQSPCDFNITKTRFSFDDFFRVNREKDTAGFLTPRPGYFKTDFFKGREAKKTSSEDEFRSQMQRIICDHSCRLEGFISERLPRRFREMFGCHIRAFVRFACRVCSFRLYRSW